jgi:ribosomal protein S18 acetylase RimI-like enzyme
MPEAHDAQDGAGQPSFDRTGLTNAKVVLVAEVVLPLTIRDLTRADLPACTWAGSATHLAAIAAALDRAGRGEVEYLAACPSSGLPVGLCAIDYIRRPCAGTLWILEVHPAMQSRGIGTLLIGAAEHRISGRGLDRAELSVEESNPRARALYERLGYHAYGSEPDGWNAVAEDGSVFRYETVCTLMRKELRARS